MKSGMKMIEARSTVQDAGQVFWSRCYAARVYTRVYSGLPREPRCMPHKHLTAYSLIANSRHFTRARH